jgi:ribosomal protein S18 acetylase RimI-like enzyme
LPAVTPIRAATADDIPAVLALWERERSDAAVTEDTEDALMRAIEPGALLVAERDGRLSGTLIAAWDGWRGNLYRLVVEPADRRKGVGRDLIVEGERRLKALGATRITALVGRSEHEAAAFWQATGYDDDPKVARFVRNV